MQTKILISCYLGFILAVAAFSDSITNSLDINYSFAFKSCEHSEYSYIGLEFCLCFLGVLSPSVVIFRGLAFDFFHFISFYKRNLNSTIEQQTCKNR